MALAVNLQQGLVSFIIKTYSKDLLIEGLDLPILKDGKFNLWKILLKKQH